LKRHLFDGDAGIIGRLQAEPYSASIRPVASE